MTNLLGLYRMADDNGVAVDFFRLEKREALSFMDPNGECFVAIDPLKLTSIQDETMKLAHELGHCCTGSFYNRYSPFEIRQRHENKADKWAIENLISAEDLDGAVADGYTDLWSLAEYFDVTEDFMRKVVCWYTCGNLDIDWYF